jgi:tetratricopeptide (TPR) repeat protein
MCSDNGFVAIVLSMLAFGLIGCNSQKSDAPVQGVGSNTAEEMNAQRSAFENSEDPPLTAETHYAAGQFAESQAANGQAIKQYEQAIKLAPGHSGALFRLGMIYTNAKEYPKAIEYWKRYLAATNNSPIGYSNLALAQQAAGDYKAAESTFQSGIKKDPKNQAVRINYGLMLAKIGRIKDALTQFQAVLTPAQAHYNVASVFEEMGKPDDARMEYTKALELDPTLADAQERLNKLK